MERADTMVGIARGGEGHLGEDAELAVSLLFITRPARAFDIFT